MHPFSSIMLFFFFFLRKRISLKEAKLLVAIPFSPVQLAVLKYSKPTATLPRAGFVNSFNQLFDSYVDNKSEFLLAVFLI